MLVERLAFQIEINANTQTNFVSFKNKLKHLKNQRDISNLVVASTMTPVDVRRPDKIRNNEYSRLANEHRLLSRLC